MADPIQDSLIREIDEDLRRERYAKLWKTYGGYVVAAAVLLVVGVAGYQGWRSYDLDRREATAALLAKATTLASDDPVQALVTLRSVAEAGGGFATLARFREAALLARGGDREGALSIYRRLEAEAADPLFRDLAVVLGALHRLHEAGSGVDRAEIEGRLGPIAADGNPWRHSAREIVGILALQAGEARKAEEMFAALVADLEAPEGMRARASELLAAARGS
ncbi:MAG: tetratricopeptide repeat protein [Rhodospirillales bacterium]